MHRSNRVTELYGHGPQPSIRRGFSTHLNHLEKGPQSGKQEPRYALITKRRSFSTKTNRLVTLTFRDSKNARNCALKMQHGPRLHECTGCACTVEGIAERM